MRATLRATLCATCNPQHPTCPQQTACLTHTQRKFAICLPKWQTQSQPHSKSLPLVTNTSQVPNNLPYLCCFPEVSCFPFAQPPPLPHHSHTIPFSMLTSPPPNNLFKWHFANRSTALSSLCTSSQLWALFQHKSSNRPLFWLLLADPFVPISCLFAGQFVLCALTTLQTLQHPFSISNSTLNAIHFVLWLFNWSIVFLATSSQTLPISSIFAFSTFFNCPCCPGVTQHSAPIP